VLRRIFSRLAKLLWGDLTVDEYKKFGILSFLLFLILASYWLLRPLKDALLNEIVGFNYQPIAKVVTLITFIPMMFLYSKLVNLVEKHKLFYVVSGFYFVVFLIISIMLRIPGIGIFNSVPNPRRILGWAIYVSCETFGSIMVSVFWSFVASIAKTETAKRGYALVIAGAQLGSITGPTIARLAPVVGAHNLVAFVLLGILAIPLVIILFRKVVPPSLQDEKPFRKSAKKPTSIFEGIRLIVTRPYIAGIFVVATIFEVAGTILDFHMKTLAFSRPGTTIDENTNFLGFFGQMSNGLTLLFALFGVSFLLRRIGVRFCLIMFPIAAAAIVISFYFFPVLNVALVSMILFKAFNYALNNASKEILYIPTAKDIKFKAKSWIDTFGNRLAKVGGATVTNFFSGDMAALLKYGTIISLAVISFWLAVAVAVGNKFVSLQSKSEIVS